MITYKSFHLDEYGDGLIVTDAKIADLYKIHGKNVYLLPQGEQSKSFCEAEKLCRWFVDNNLKRGGKVTAIGGGSVGDTVGFACSVYKRGGVSLTHVPTTLLAQIDSAIGGKTALNVGDVKNAVGSFYRANTVIDVNFLKTLDAEQILSGQGELLKYRMLSPEIESVYSGEITEDVIKACVEYKTEICNVDPFDKNVRKKLNFGHTIGHAAELAYGITHGHAVCMGIHYETLLAYRLKTCGKDYFDKWTEEAAKLFTMLPLNGRILDLTLSDKKNEGEEVCFALPTEFDLTYLTRERVAQILCCD